MSLDITIVQHADKIRLPGDHGLTRRGKEQACARGDSLRAAAPFDEVWCSNLKRSRETAEIIAGSLGLLTDRIQEDRRIAERINWWNEDDQSRQEFREDWVLSTVDRSYQPRFGDSSRAAGDRFAACLMEIRERLPEGRVLIISHGGVTIDLVRTWFGDEVVRQFALGAIEHGIEPCAITRILVDGDRKSLHSLGDESPSMS
jgi:probable phosphoglycerate mutase